MHFGETMTHLTLESELGWRLAEERGDARECAHMREHGGQNKTKKKTKKQKNKKKNNKKKKNKKKKTKNKKQKTKNKKQKNKKKKRPRAGACANLYHERVQPLCTPLEVPSRLCRGACSLFSSVRWARLVLSVLVSFPAAGPPTPTYLFRASRRTSHFPPRLIDGQA